MIILYMGMHEVFPSMRNMLLFHVRFLSTIFFTILSTHWEYISKSPADKFREWALPCLVDASTHRQSWNKDIYT